MGAEKLNPILTACSQAVLFTDIVGATTRVVELGDRAWKDLLTQHHLIVREQLRRHRGREINTMGDGFLAAFDGPARAVRCGQTIVDAVKKLGIHIRAGVHTGECEVMGENLGGIAVHIGAENWGFGSSRRGLGLNHSQGLGGRIRPQV